MFLRFLTQNSMNPYVYPTGFGRCPFGCSAGPCRHRAGFGTTYGQSGRPVWGKYRACITHMGAFWTTHDSLQVQNRKPNSESCSCSSFSHELYGPVRVQKSSKIVQTHSAVIRPVSDQNFRYALNWQTRTKSFFI